ncbi:C4-dicarboxylate TRAP transporter substrate-binding protein [Salipiger sp. PrR002]|uniref:C4-dicarboxylate TRAP transporter substrate-binding protein n=1 Tax=Salipiger sp. PrR002 TaxID=2706489 RepID=UPI0013B68278|nr:C4-dicarboxylate TRAP transporter substrate-binding protein [Salipiger sp. PrR002]NDW02016.1 C4-dicarboxylate ABC transporter substrate-binding protein [Salipiger sp. PrR002]NDW59056.1 C4-dicarboxylate ABC transporter substrate-binding protein [Salipiger sp. PrR004]
MTIPYSKILSAAVACAALAVPAQAETKFIANDFFDAATPLAKYTYLEWAEQVKALSDGDLVPDVYTGTVLLAPRANLQGTQDNIVQLAHQSAVYTPSEMPVANAVQELGFNYSDQFVMQFAISDFSMHNQIQMDEWRDLGLVYLGGYATPPYVLFCREPVRNLAELKGKRIRTAGSTVSAWVEEAGGIPVNVPSSEMYTGLERGTLDCASNAANDLIDRSLWEVSEHTTLLPTGMYWSGPMWGYNADFWASLTDDNRSVLMTATARAMVRLAIGYDAAARDALEASAEKGNNIYEPEADLMESVEAFRAKALEGIYETAEQKYGITDAQALIDDFRAVVEKWEGLLEGVDRSDEDALTALVESEIYDTLEPASYGIN